MTARLGFYLICCVSLFGCDTGDENGGTLVFVSDAGGDVDAVVDGDGSQIAIAHGRITAFVTNQADVR